MKFRRKGSTRGSRHQEKASEDVQVQERKASHCLSFSDTDAPVYPDKAPDCFKKAVNESPGNVKSLEAAAKATVTHMELLKQHGFQQAIGGGQATTSNSNAKYSKLFSESSDLKYYDIFGWIILVVGIVSWVSLPKSNVPPPPPG